MPVTLSRHLGTLTPGWFYHLADTELTPGALTPRVYGDGNFGVQQNTEGFLLLNAQLVLYIVIYLGGGQTAV